MPQWETESFYILATVFFKNKTNMSLTGWYTEKNITDSNEFFSIKYEKMRKHCLQCAEKSPCEEGH